MNIRNALSPLLVSLGFIAAPAFAQTNSSTEVPPVNLASIKVSDFADDELDLPFYLANFSRVANAVPLEGDLRGWITVSVWRGNSNQRTYNARVLESQLSLVYFYCTKRPWNPYYGSPAVRAHLEAMLERWCNMQDANGEFSEYAEGRPGLAPTAFATKFMGESLRLLAHGPPIDAKLYERVKQAQRRAIIATLTDPAMWEHGKEYANQFSNIFAGGLAWLALHPDDKEVHDLLLRRMKESLTGLQSPAGYFYERGGPDWGYSLSTHHSNLEIAWNYARGNEFEPLVREMVQRYYDWLAMNAVLEPDGSGFVLNRAIETRQRHPWHGIIENAGGRNYSSTPQAEVIELARAFVPSREQERAAQAEMRAELEKSWPNLPGLSAGDFRAFTPYAFLHRSMYQWLPTAAQQAAAQRELPYVKRDRFTQLRADDRHSVQYLFVRRPGYYVAFNSGNPISKSQRFGLGLLWVPGAGTVAQSQSASDSAVWGTTAANASAPYEADTLNATFKVAENLVQAKPGTTELSGDKLTVEYPLGKNGKKTIQFNDARIGIRISHSGDFVESIPLLVRETDNARVEKNRLLLERDGKTVLTIEFDSGTTIDWARAERTGRIGQYRMMTARASGKDQLSYSIAFVKPK